MTDEDRALLARVQKLPAYPLRPRWTDALMDYEDPTVVWMYWKTGGAETGSPVHHYGQA